MVFGNFFDSEDTQVKFKLIYPLLYVDRNLNFAKAAVAATTTAVTSAPAMVVKVLNELASNQGKEIEKINMFLGIFRKKK